MLINTDSLYDLGYIIKTINGFVKITNLYYLDRYFYQPHKILDAINENVTHYGLPELKSNKFADVWPISIDRPDLGYGGVESGNLSYD